MNLHVHLKKIGHRKLAKNTAISSKETLENIFLKPLYFESDTAHLDYLQQSPAGIDCLRGAGKESYILGEWEITPKNRFTFY